jgi:mono/diheme cytochrome c family protein
MPDMAYGPAKKAQYPGTTGLPVKGTVPREGVSYPYGMADAEKAGKELKNPLMATPSVLARGADRFNTYCLVCHGPKGEGDGSIIPKFPRPPTIHSDKVRGWSDGRLFHVITMGQGLMPKYAVQIPAEDRWAIIHHIRALQKAKNPSPDDVSAAKAAGEVQ